MKTRSANHHVITLERVFDFPPSLVFFAHADAGARSVWFSGPSDWEKAQPGVFDFRVGGRELSSAGPRGGPLHTYDSHYLDIVPDERIINAFTILIDGSPLTASLATTEFSPHGSGTRLKLTEQIVFLDGSDHLENRIEGTAAALDGLEGYLKSAYRETSNG